MTGELPDAFDHLQKKVADWADRPVPEFELSSDRVVEATDPDQHVWVRIRSFEIDSLQLAPQWLALDPPAPVIEDSIRQAVNIGLRQYWQEELTAAREAATPMAEIADGLRELSLEFRDAYERSFARLERHL